MSKEHTQDELLWNIEYWRGKKSVPYNILTLEESKKKIEQIIKEYPYLKEKEK